MYPLGIVEGSHDFAQSVDPMGLSVECTGNVDCGESALLVQQKALVDIEPRDDRHSEVAHDFARIVDSVGLSEESTRGVPSIWIDRRPGP